MATVQLDHSRHQTLMQHFTWEPLAWTPSGLHRFVQGLGRLIRQGVGGAILLFGCAMLFTLWLIPVGLPLALLGMAMISG